jgi:arginine N-succinyltransferase
MSASTDGQFILDLSPRHPIYVELLPEAAREAVGKVHREGEGARVMLERERFRYSGLVDLFDAGPTMTCVRDDIATVREAQRLRLKIGTDLGEEIGLVTTHEIGRFRGVRVPVRVEGDTAVISPDAAEALRARGGDVVRVKT